MRHKESLPSRSSQSDREEPRWKRNHGQKEEEQGAREGAEVIPQGGWSRKALCMTLKLSSQQ